MAENEWLQKDFYRTLGVNKDASSAEITKAYRKLARKYHPDLHHDDAQAAEEKFKDISQAYDVLNDKEKRQQYDAIRQFGAGGARFAGGAGGFNASGFSDIFGSMFQTTGGGTPHMRFSSSQAPGGMNDIFSMFTGGSTPYTSYSDGGYADTHTAATGQRPTAVKGEDLTARVELALRQAVKGATISLMSQGAEFKTRIPAGVKDGQKIRLAGKGKAGLYGGAHGDLYLTVKVLPDERFSMRGRDLLVQLPVSVGQAVNGAKITTHDIDGNEVVVKVAPGSSSGTEIAVAGKGVPACADRPAGSLVAIVRICIPQKPNRAVKKAAQQFDEMTADFLASLSEAS